MEIYHHGFIIKQIQKAIWYFLVQISKLTLKDDAIAVHRILKGKIGIQSRVTADFSRPSSEINIEGKTISGKKETGNESEKNGKFGILELIYTPGVAYVAEKITNNKELLYEYTSKWNNVAIVCDGTRVLGLGDIGPQGALPVMEGKSVLFKLLGDINAYPLCINTKNKDEIISFIKAAEPTFGAINIEDIESPKVLEIVEKLQKDLPIPVFHDDQHGTSIIALAALLNALELVNKPDINKVKVVVAGAGSAGYGISKILKQAGCNFVMVTDSHGIIYPNRPGGSYNKYKEEIASISNPSRLKGSLEDAIAGADVFIGVSGRPNLIDERMVKSMNTNPVIFALSNPEPEIDPSRAVAAGAKVVATGRSDYPNQINNVSVFPSMLRVLLDFRVKYLDEDLLVAVAKGIASLVEREQLRAEYILPPIDDPRVLAIVSEKLRDVVRKHLGN
ncbi:MAG TPA: malic enzyme-like NAD(P)-binding protein [Nitrososphaeraceae archaeon]|jgi:malate dehydrogenase (oxaloacetate-decarboxylating)|nr:malic enzyme-like NAD(P)-binding protein [Nitrososphaeraceae archaeon]